VIKHLLFLDFETYYDTAYSLRCMTIPEYLLDNKFEMILCAVAEGSTPSVIVEGSEFRDFLKLYPPESTATVTFNALFDNAILAWHYNYVPARMYDTMNMARALRGHLLPRFSLKAVCEGLGLRHKTGTLAKVTGCHGMDIKHLNLWQEYCDYANNDNEANRDIFKLLIGELPRSEQRVMDLVIRATVEPRLYVDTFHMTQHLEDIKRRKEALLARCGVGKGDLLSAQKFEQALKMLGVEIEYKDGKAGPIPCFAKTDAFMERLKEHEDPDVQALVCARLGVKSTLGETRTQKFRDIGNLPWPGSLGTMPFPLRYSGAHTHRLSGEWKLNLQNLPR
jgi:hypothetical protein